MNWSHVGEFGLIERIRHIAGSPRPPLITGIGDDAAVLSPTSATLALVSTDAMVEGRHFLRAWMTPAQIGARAAAAALSDIAAMGGIPTALLCSLCIGSGWTVAEIEELVQGASDLGRRFRVSLAGGDVVTAGVRDDRCSVPLMIDMVALGQVQSDRVWLRSAAQAGDRVLVTGMLGGAAAAIALHTASSCHRQSRFGSLQMRLTSPIPRLDVSALLGPMSSIHAAIDISDGLLQDAGHVAAASGMRLQLHAATIPVDRQLLDCATLLGDDPLNWAVAGGEDYELLLTAPLEKVPEMQDALREIGVPLTDIGEVVEGEGVALLDGDGAEMKTSKCGWDHFRA